MSDGLLSTTSAPLSLLESPMWLLLELWDKTGNWERKTRGNAKRLQRAHYKEIIMKMPHLNKHPTLKCHFYAGRQDKMACQVFSRTLLCYILLSSVFLMQKHLAKTLLATVPGVLRVLYVSRLKHTSSESPRHETGVWDKENIQTVQCLVAPGPGLSPCQRCQTLYLEGHPPFVQGSPTLFLECYRPEDFSTNPKHTRPN